MSRLTAMKSEAFLGGILLACLPGITTAQAEAPAHRADVPDRTAPPLVFVGERVAVDRWDPPPQLPGQRDGPSFVYSARYRVLEVLEGEAPGDIVAIEGEEGLYGAWSPLPEFALIRLQSGQRVAEPLGMIRVQRTSDGDWGRCGWYQVRGMGPPPPVVPLELLGRPFDAPDEPLEPDADGIARDEHGEHVANAFEWIDGVPHCRRGVRVRDLHAWVMRTFVDPADER